MAAPEGYDEAVLTLVLERQFRAVHDQVESPGQMVPAGRSDDVGPSIDEAVTVAVCLWDAVKRSVTRHPPGGSRASDQDYARRLMSLYRLAERTNSLLRSVAERSGDCAADLGRLIEVQRECRGELLMPTARRIARRDLESRTPEQIRDILLDRVDFSPIDGRPVIPPEATVGLPCPFDPEPAV